MMGSVKFQPPTLAIKRVKAGAAPFDAKDLGDVPVTRAISMLGAAAIISASGELGTAAGRISSVTSPSHW